MHPVKRVSYWGLNISFEYKVLLRFSQHELAEGKKPQLAKPFLGIACCYRFQYLLIDPKK